MTAEVRKQTMSGICALTIVLQRMSTARAYHEHVALVTDDCCGLVTGHITLRDYMYTQAII